MTVSVSKSADGLSLFMAAHILILGDLLPSCALPFTVIKCDYGAEDRWVDLLAKQTGQELIPDTATRLWSDLKGIDIGKPAEMTAYVSHDGNLTLYDGFYHICGSILTSPKLFIKIDEKHFQLDENATIKLTPDHFAYFTKECALVDKEFPTPVIQLEIQGNVPWVLDEPNPYHYPDV